MSVKKPIGIISNSGFMHFQYHLAKYSDREIRVWFTDAGEEGSLTEDSLYNMHSLPNIKLGWNGKQKEMIDGCEMVFIETFRSASSVPKLERIKKYCKSKNIPVFGCANPDMLKLELDRVYAKEVGEKLGFDPYPSEVIRVNNHQELCEAVDKITTSNCVVKSDYEHADRSTYIPINKQDAKDTLAHDPFNFFGTTKVRGKEIKGSAVVESFLEGHEFFFGFYFNGKEIASNTILVNQEYKNAVDDAMGGNILTGEVGTVIHAFNLKDLPNRIQSIINKLISDYLIPNEYRGFIDMACMYNEKTNKLYLMEFTVRVGLPTEAIVMNMVDNYENLILWQAGVSNKHPKFSKGFVLSGVLYTYGEPYDIDLPSALKPKIYGIDSLKKNFVPFNCYLEGNDLRSCMGSRIGLITTIPKASLEDAKKEYLKEQSKVKCWHHIMRTDIGWRWKMPNLIREKK